MIVERAGRRGIVGIMLMRLYLVHAHHAVKLTCHRKTHGKPYDQECHKLAVENSANRLSKTFVWMILTCCH